MDAIAAKGVEEPERELARKEKALAEKSALIALKDKIEAMLEDEDDSTNPRNEL